MLSSLPKWYNRTSKILAASNEMPVLSEPKICPIFLMHHSTEAPSLIGGEFLKNINNSCNTVSQQTTIYHPQKHTTTKHVGKATEAVARPPTTEFRTSLEKKGCFSDYRELLYRRSTRPSLIILLEPWTKMSCDKYNNFESLTWLQPCYIRKSLTGKGIFTPTIYRVLHAFFKLFSFLAENNTHE